MTLINNCSDPTVSVIIPVYNDQKGLDITLQSLLLQNYPENKFEVVVVDNGSIPRLTISAEHMSNIRLDVCTKPGSYAARNYGVEIAVGEVYAFIDADCVAAPDWLKNGVTKAVAQNRPVAGNVQFITDSSSPNTAELLQITMGFGQESSVQKQYFGATANLFVPKSVFDKVGNFNEDLLSGGDRYWGWMAYDAGLMVLYEDSAVVSHPCRSSVRSLVKQVVRVAGGRYILSSIKPKGIDDAQLQPKLSALRAFRYVWTQAPVDSLISRLKVTAFAAFLWLVRKLTALLFRFGLRPIRG